MRTLRKVLILSASLGEGHQKASTAIKEALERSDSSIEVKIIDYLQMVHPILNSIACYCYIQSVRYVPPLYAFFYNSSRNLKQSKGFQKYLNRLGINELEQYIKSFKPDLVISTFPTPAGVMSVLKERGIIDVPAATVITDHAIHNQWIHSHTDMYFVGSDYVKQGLIQRGIPEYKIHITGIPIRPLFRNPVDRLSLIQKYQLRPDLPTVLVMGGSYGVLKDITNICEELFGLSTTTQVLVVCGRNERLYSKIQELAKNASNPVQVFGFIQEINELMAVSDLMITKAGGLTISESLAMELPMLLYRPIPGQETQNATYLVHSKVALLAKNRNQVFEHFRNFISSDASYLALKSMRMNAKKIKTPFAADHIVHILQESMQIITKNYMSNQIEYKRI